MASTPEGRRLTELHRLEQQQVRDGFLEEFIALWVLLDTAHLDATGPGWVGAAMRLIRSYRRLSAEVATEYFHDFAAAESPETPGRPRVPDLRDPSTPRAPERGGGAPERAPRRRSDGSQSRRPRGEDVIPEPRRSGGVRFEFDESAFERDMRRTRIEIPDIDWTPRDRAAQFSLEITGPIGQKSKIKKGRSEREARDTSFVQSSGVGARHVLDGGRQSALRLITTDDRLVGYIRVTDSDPCSFCAMLASRGPVYRTPKRAGPNVRGPRNPRAGLAFEGEGAFKVHDHCACTVEPVYTRDTGWPGRGREFQKLWNDHISGRYSGDEAIREWRRLYERLQREARRRAA